MSIFNEKQIKAMESGTYICSECGKVMEFEDKWEDTLVCPHCGHSVDQMSMAVKEIISTKTYIQPEKKFSTLQTRTIVRRISKNIIS